MKRLVFSVEKSDVSERDARAMVRLLGEVAACDGGHTVLKSVLMDGLCELVGANAWVWTLGTRKGLRETQRYAGFLHSGFDDERFAKLLSVIEDPKISEIGEYFYSAVDSVEPITMLREEIDEEGLCDSPDLRPLWREANIRSMMISGHPLDDHALSSVGLYRAFDDDCFTERERQIVHIILSEVPWLHLMGWPKDAGVTVPRLFPRQRIVLNLLLNGLSRKEIADKMMISESTVAGYTKDVYKKFRVTSQVNLVRKFFGRN